VSEERQSRFSWESNLERGFKEFHEANPHVYAKLRDFAVQARHSGRKHLGIAAVFERLRWWASFEVSGDEFKLNNNWRAFYSRMLMDREPTLSGFFETRKSVSDK